MLLSIIIVIYISWVCHSFGCLINKILQFKSANLPELFFWKAVLGFCAIIFFASVASLFIPLGGYEIHLILLLLSLTISFRNFSFFTDLKAFVPRNFVFIALLIVTALLALVMHSWFINHPDTVEYHAETIGWINRSKAIQGLSFLNHRIGYGGNWYVVSSLFSFHFAGLNALTFINIVVPLWFISFFVKKAEEYQKKEGAVSFIIIMIFILSFLVFSFIRLTFISASPDYITSLFILLILYYLLSGCNNIYILVLLIATAITIKLFALPLIVFLIIYSLRELMKGNLKKVIISTIFFIIILSPFVARNIIITGYAIFPYPELQIKNAKFTLPPETAEHEKAYIKAYNRIPVDYNNSYEVKKVANFPIKEWVPIWWNNKPLADKIFLLISLTSVLALVVLIKKIIARGEYVLLYCIITTLSGIVFWFYYAPEIRLGGGFLLAAPALAILSYKKTGQSTNFIIQKFTRVITILLTIVLFLYSIYRFAYYFDESSLLYPKGVTQKVSYSVERLKLIPITKK